MSWYNNIQDNTFIDATQQNNSSTGDNLIVNEGDTEITNNLGFNSKITDLIKLKFEDGVFNLYLQNLNKNQLITLAANIAVIDTTLYAPVTGLTIRMPLVETAVALATSINIEQDARLTVLELDAQLGEITQLEFDNALD